MLVFILSLIRIFDGICFVKNSYRGVLDIGMNLDTCGRVNLV